MGDYEVRFCIPGWPWTKVDAESFGDAAAVTARKYCDEAAWSLGAGRLHVRGGNVQMAFDALVSDGRTIVRYVSDADLETCRCSETVVEPEVTTWSVWRYRGRSYGYTLETISAKTPYEAAEICAKRHAANTGALDVLFVVERCGDIHERAYRYRAMLSSGGAVFILIPLTDADWSAIRERKV